MNLWHLDYRTSRGQCIVLLLRTLRDIGPATKFEAVKWIERQHWFSVEPADREPYPSQRYLSNEPRWHTLIAWARKDSVLHGLISDEERDLWGLTRKGCEVINRLQEQFCSATSSVDPCYLWSREFKVLMCPSYVPGPNPAQRPLTLYRDVGQGCWKALLAAKEELDREQASS